MKHSILYEDEHLVVVHHPAKGSPTLVTFADLTFRPQGTRIWGEDLVARLGVNAIGFVARRENWYPTDSVAAAAPAVRAALRGPAVAYGYSMGGYAALKHAARLGAGFAFAVCPQSSIAPADAPWDSRFHRYHRPEQHPGMPVRAGEAGQFSLLLADPYMPEDRRHAERLAAEAGVHWLRTPFMDHASIWLLVDSAFLAQVLQHIQAHDLAGLTQLMRDRRHTSPHWFRHAGNAAFRHGHVAMANRLWQRALELGLPSMVLEQDIGRLLPQRMQALRQAGRLQAARDLALQQAALRPADFTSQANAAHALLGMNESEAAEAPFRAALALRQDVGHIFQGLSLVLANLGRLPEAVQVGQRGVGAVPGDLALQMHYGHLLLNAAKVNEAEEQFRAVLEKEPASRQALLGLSHTLAARGSRAEAIEAARQVIAEGGTDAGAFLWLGQLLLYVGEPAEAEPVFRDALAAAPEIGAAHIGLARALERTGQLEEARRVAAEAARLLPQDPKVQAIASRLGPPSRATPEQAVVQASPVRRWLHAFFSRDDD
ncbi:tetratricopeptide repeat protein [Roseomonas sp. M0104]|uniref:Tetratricopeptide repeat protein n=1 Tax=Teichococcus coralli TaxID=2545983 RepID=A0A845BH49_9PROT|nr:tetratricopeptide repeat protein [Pseudoroseomonas coralli]MXP65384.1 tetratricopeptide repeat protein [Pseudoroseomonas coralli]